MRQEGARGGGGSHLSERKVREIKHRGAVHVSEDSRDVVLFRAHLEDGELDGFDMLQCGFGRRSDAEESGHDVAENFIMRGQKAVA